MRGGDDFVFRDGGGRDKISDFSISGGDGLQLDDALWGGKDWSAAKIVTTFAELVDRGVLFNFGDGRSILLQGLDSTAGLAGQIDFI